MKKAREGREYNLNRKTINILGNILMLLSFAFIIRRIIKYDIDFKDIFSMYTSIIAVIAIIAYAAFVLVLANLFKSLLQIHAENSLSANNIISIYCKSNLFKYLPGNIFHYIGRNQIAVEEGIAHGKVLFTTILETLFLVFAALIISIIFSGQYAYRWLIKENGNKIIIVSIILVAGILSIILYKFNPRIKKWIISYIEQAKKTKPPITVKFIALYAGTFIFNGIMFAVILNSIERDLSKIFILPIIGIYAFSWVIGFITPGAPAGLGIREAMMCALLSNVVDGEIVITAVVIYRLITILGDILAFLIANGLKGSQK